MSEASSKIDKFVTIDDDLAPEDAANENGDGNGSEFEPVVDACPNCEAFRANTAQAWQILRDLHQNEKELADVEKERDQLQRREDESREYISVVRKQLADQEKLIRERDEIIRQREERIANIEDQYNRVLKAGTEYKKVFDELTIMKSRNASLEAECAYLQEQLSKSVEREKSLNSTLNKAVHKIQRETPSGSVAGAENEPLLSPARPEEAIQHVAEPIIEEHSPVQQVAVQEAEDDNLVMAEDDDDLALELPPSPARQDQPEDEEKPPEEEKEKQGLPPISVNAIFNSNFFLEQQKMPLLDGIGDFEEKQELVQHQVTEVSDEILDGSKPTHLAIHEISKKYKLNKGEAALALSQGKRNQAKKRGRKRQANFSDDDDAASVSTVATTSTSQRLEVPKFQMPWMPHQSVLPKAFQNSMFSCEDHRRYIGIIVNSLKAKPTYRFEHNRLELKAMDEKLASERGLFERTALQMAKEKQFIRAFRYRNDDAKLFIGHQNAKIDLYIGGLSFQGVQCTVPWTDDNDGSKKPLNFHITKVLSSGHPGTISIPDIQRRLELKTTDIGRMLDDSLKKKIPIVADAKVLEYAVANDVPISMDASTLRHLLCSSWSPHRRQKYACRVTVLHRVHSGAMRKIIVLSPPIVASRLHSTTIPQAMAHWALKKKLLHDDCDEKLDEKQGTSNQTLSLLDELGLSGLVSNENDGQMDKRYAIVNFDERDSEQQKHQVLIRAGLHGIEKGTSHQISLTGRAEFMPEIGAEKFTRDEQIWNIATAVLKGSQEHANFRIAVPSNITPRRLPATVLQYDRKLNDFTRLDQGIRQKLAARIERFCSLLDALLELDSGEYLLIPGNENEGDDNLQIIKEVKEAADEQEVSESEELESIANNKGVFYDADWFKEMLRKKIIPPSNDLQELWNGIDPHYPLQWHVVKGQIPGALIPKRPAEEK